MAKPSVGARVVLDGETEFKRALSNINAGLRVNKSEMDLLTTRYSKNADSIEALTAKGGAFENQILTQTDKINILEQALASSTKEYGEADKRTMTWQTSLNQAKIELIKMNDELDNNQKALKKAATGTSDFNNEISKIDAGLRVNKSEMELLIAQYSKSTDSVEALIAKDEALNNQISSQTDKVKKLEQALVSSIKEYGEVDERTMTWQTSLNQAKTELLKMDDELDNNQKALKKATTETSDFNDEISKIEATVGVNKSEMDLLTAKYSKNADSIEALTAKGGAFENQILTQTDKINILEQALASSTKEYGTSDKKTMEWQTSLNKANSELIKLTESQEENTQAINKAKTDLAKMNTELDENQDTLKKSSKETSKLDGLLKGLSDKMGIDLPPAFSRMADGLNSTTGKSLALVGAIGSIVIGLGKMTLETSKVADDLLTLSSTSGMTTDQLQELRYASELVDVSVETMDGSMTKLIRSMDDANKGSKEQMAAFRELRISYRDSNGQLKDSNEVFFSTIDALGKVTNETERDALAMTLLGKSARDLNPLIEAGSGKLKELGEEAHAVGYVMDSETLNSFGAMDDSLQRIKNQAQTLKMKLAEALLPVISKLLDMVASVPGPVWTVIGVLTAVIGTILGISKAITVISAASAALAGTNFILGASFTRLLPAVLLVALALAGLAAVYFALKNGDKGDDTNIKKIADDTGLLGNNLNSQVNSRSVNENGLNSQVNSRSTQNAGSRIPPYALGTAYHSGGFARVNDRQNDPTSGEIIDLPTGSRVYPKGTSPSSGGDIFNITIDAKNVKDFNDIVTMAQAARQQRRSR